MAKPGRTATLSINFVHSVKVEIELRTSREEKSWLKEVSCIHEFCFFNKSFPSPIYNIGLV